MVNQLNTFEHSRRALAVFDAGAEERQKAWDSIDTAEDVEACEKADLQAEALVQEAFFQDAKDINSRKNCGYVRATRVRELVERSQKSGPEDDDELTREELEGLDLEEQLSMIFAHEDRQEEKKR